MKYKLYDKVKSSKFLDNGTVVAIKHDNDGTFSTGYHYVVNSNGRYYDLKEEEMQILKANSGKSVTVQHIVDSSNSICFIYGTGWMPSFDCFILNDEDISIKQLIVLINEQINIIKNKHFDYLVVYTNNTEEELKDLIKWLNENSNKLNVRDILITCKSEV